MDLSIRHDTDYAYDVPVDHGLQRLRLTPADSPSQQIDEWTTEIEGGRKEVAFTDHFGNLTELVSIDAGVTTLRVAAFGRIRTTDTNGIADTQPGLAPLWLFRRSTPTTQAGPAVTELAESFDGFDAGPVALVHELSHRVGSAVEYQPGHTTSIDSAEEALSVGRGVCQDHAHVFLAVARKLDFPARYVSGYLFMDETDDQDATHAWVEVWIDGLGWVGLDPSNGISPDERYVRLATGLDYPGASPISGIRFGTGRETLDVTVRIEGQRGAGQARGTQSQSQTESTGSDLDAQDQAQND